MQVQNAIGSLNELLFSDGAKIQLINASEEPPVKDRLPRRWPEHGLWDR